MLVIIFFYISNTFYRCYQKETPVKINKSQQRNTPHL